MTGYLLESWGRTIIKCVETVNMSILWNDKKLDWFRPSRGIRQGDAISPYLFLLCMERLGHIIGQAVEEGRWKPIKLSRHGPTFSHIFFVDDLLFAEASPSQMDTIMECLNTFCSASGQKISLPKSSIAFFVDVDKEVACRISASSKISISTNLAMYLGFPSIMGCTSALF